MLETIKEHFKDFVENMKERSGGTFTGPFLVSVILWNLKPLLVLCFAEANMESRLAFLTQEKYGNLGDLEQYVTLNMKYFFTHILGLPALSAILYLAFVPALNNWASWLKNFSDWNTASDRLRHEKQIRLLKTRLFKAYGSLARHAPDSNEAIVGKLMTDRAREIAGTGGTLNRNENIINAINVAVEEGFLKPSGNPANPHFKLTDDGKMYLEVVVGQKVDHLD